MKNQEKKVVGDVKSFTVDRTKWYRGQGNQTSCLLNNSGKMCCLGFYALACDLDPKIIKNMYTPQSVVGLLNGFGVYAISGKCVTRKSNMLWKTKLVSGDVRNSRTCQNLMSTNDEEDISDEKREKKLTSLFKKIGITIKFKG